MTRVFLQAIRASLWTWLAVALGAAHAQVPSNPYNYSRTTSYTYDPTTGFVSAQTVEPNNAPSCVLTTYGYDTSGNRTSATTANCAAATGGAVFTSRTSSSNYMAPPSQPITVTDNSNVTSSVAVSYPPGLFPTTVSNAVGQSETHGVDPRFGTVTLLTGPNLLNTTWVIDDFGRKTKETHADGTSVLTFYCVLPSTGLDTTGNTPGCPTPSAGEAPADAVAFVHSEARDVNGTKMGPFARAYTDRLGRTIRSATESFDGASQPAARSGVVVVQDTVYNIYGAKIVETQPYFLASGSSTTGGSNNVGATLTSVDVLGRPTSVYAADPNGQAGTQTFGAYGAQPSAKTSYAYAGLTLTVTNDKGQTRIEEKNAIGEMVRVTDAAGAQLAHQRDAFGNLLATKDALQNTIAVVYDIAGRKTQMTDPDAGAWGYCYDALGQLTAQQNSTMRGSNIPGACPSNTNNGSVATTVTGWTTLAYDKLGRITQRIEPEYTSTWTYDQYADASTCNKGQGKLCQVVTSNGVNRKVVYDNLGRAINGLTTTGTGPNFASAIAYDTVTGRVASETYPTGLQVGFAYTARGFLEKLTLMTAATVNPLPSSPGGTPGASANLAAGAVLWQAQVVNAWNATERQLYGNGVTANAVYEAATGRSTDITAGAGGATTVLNHHYSWDSLNNLVARNDANGDGGSGAVTETFSYGDGLNRLTGYTVAAPGIPGLSRTVTLQYNALGMLLYKSDVGAYAYAPQGANSVRPHALLTVTGSSTTTNGYDANGNLVSASSGKYRAISYTSFNLPDSQSGITGPNGTPKYTWNYDDGHARVKEVRTIVGGSAAGTRTTWYLHPDNEGGLGFESEVNSPTSPSPDNPAVTSNRHFLSASGQPIGVLISTGNLPTLGSGQTAPAALASVTLVKVEYWHRDHLGSLVATTDHVGTVTARYAYDPFGKRRYTNGSYDAFGNVVVDWSSAINAGTARGFTGHEALDDIGLVHMNGRIFDATLGVFLQADRYVTDPGDLQSYNRYGYCLNNPLTCTDPSGFANSEGNVSVRPKDKGPTGSINAGLGWITVYQAGTITYTVSYTYSAPCDTCNEPTVTTTAHLGGVVPPPSDWFSGSAGGVVPATSGPPGVNAGGGRSSNVPAGNAAGNRGAGGGQKHAAPQITTGNTGFSGAAAQVGQFVQGWLVSAKYKSVLDVPQATYNSDPFKAGYRWNGFLRMPVGILSATGLVGGDSPAVSFGAAGSVLWAAKGALPELRVSASKYPQLAENIMNAQKAGHPDVIAHGGNPAANRAGALDSVPNIKGLSRDEYPFASSMQGGQGSWVGHVPPSQQNAQGALIKNFLQQNGIKAGDQYRVIVVP